MTRARAVIADDEPLMRAQLRERLAELWPELDLVAEAKNGAEAVELVAAKRPDVVFLDIRMPSRTGIQAAQDIVRLGSPVPEIVFVTAYEQHAVDAFEHGALDYVLKPAERERLARTVERLKGRLAGRRAAEPDTARLEALLERLAGRLEPSRSPVAAERRLAAILCADVVGYSRLMHADDRATHAELAELRRLAAERAAKANGRLVNSAGDSLLAEFPSVLDAVRCAVEIQRELEGRRMQLRIGVNLGDVLADGEGIYGDGVNVAARIEALCRPGRVALSAAAWEQVRDKLRLDFEDRGEHEVKNIARPVRIYETGPQAAQERGYGADASEARTGPQPSRALALALMVLAPLLWSTAGVVTRHVERATPFELVFWRSLFAFAFVAVALLAMRRNPLRLGWPGLVSGAMWGIMFTAFMLALTMTSTANTLVVMSVSPLLTTLLAAIFLKDPLPGRTWAAAGAAALGIAWMFGSDFAAHTARDLTGMLVAFAIPCAAAINVVTLRAAHASIDLRPAVMLGGAISCLIALPLALPLQASARDIALLAFLGIFQLGLPCMLLVVASRTLLAPEIALLGLLEVVLGPLWAWLGAGEVPAHSTLIGGAIVLAALVANELVTMRRSPP